MNPYSSVDRRDVLDQAMRVLIQHGHIGLADDLGRIMPEIAPDCPQCREVHGTLPITRHFHSPVCKAVGICAMCGEPHGFDGLELGLICTTCYGDEEEI